MDLRRLAALVALADHRTFSAAADALHTVQSNVSAHVARLERELGVTLVDRAAGRLTEEGRAVVTRARRIATEVDAITADMAALRDEVAGPVRLGVIGTAGRWLTARLLAALADLHPAVRPAVYEGTSASLEPQVATGRLDLAIVNMPVASPELSARALFDEDLVFVSHAGDPLVARGRLQLGDLDGLPLLLPMPGTAFRDDIEAAALTAGVTLRASAEFDGVRLIASLIFGGHGRAILPATAVPGFMREQWHAVPVEGLPRRRVGVAVRRRGLPPAPARAVLDLLHHVVADGAPEQEGLYPLHRESQ